MEKITIYPLNKIVRKSRSSGILGRISARSHDVGRSLFLQLQCIPAFTYTSHSPPPPFFFNGLVNSVRFSTSKFCLFSLWFVPPPSLAKDSKESKSTSKDDKGNALCLQKKPVLLAWGRGGETRRNGWQVSWHQEASGADALLAAFFLSKGLAYVSGCLFWKLWNRRLHFSWEIWLWLFLSLGGVPCCWSIECNLISAFSKNPGKERRNGELGDDWLPSGDFGHTKRKPPC